MPLRWLGMTSSPKSRSQYPFTSISAESTRRQRLPWLIALVTIPAIIMLMMLRGSSPSTSTPDAESLTQAPLRDHISHPTKKAIDPAPWNGAGVVPDLLPLLPSDVASISFHLISFHLDVSVQPGDRVPTAVASKQPHISWPPTDSEYYTVLMFDPDAPSRAKPTHADWLHWMVVNVRGNDLKTGDVVAEYAGPTPPKGTGPHRYVLVIYASQEPTDTKKWGKTIKADSHEGRSNYHHDTKTPIAAANFFIAEYDEGK